MNSRLVRVGIGAAALLTVWLVADWYFSDVQRIKRRLGEIQRLVAKTPAESDLASLAAARKISEFFAEPFEAHTVPAGYTATDRAQVASGIYQYRSRSASMVMEIVDQQIFIDAEGGGANSFFTARFITDLRDLMTTEQYDCKLHWSKVDGKWLIDYAQVTGVHELP